MPLDNLIPIGVASGGHSGSKKSGSTDLTSGLISIPGARDNADVDMSDFDVDDLLGDDSSKSKTKASLKDKSDDKKKKKKKSKDKAKSSSSKKKSKSKTKKIAFDDAIDDGDAADNWASSAKNWDSAAELEMTATAAIRRKNGSGKIGGALYDEFAQLLGLESRDTAGGADFGSTESPPLSPEPLRLDRHKEKTDKFDSDDTFGISGYTPTVRRATKFQSVDVTSVSEVDESVIREGERISASFFQDNDKGDLNSTLPLESTPERRRGGRRQIGGAESDPFGSRASTAPSSSTFESLFGGSSSRRNALDDPFVKSDRAPLDDNDSRQEGLIDLVEERKPDLSRNDSSVDETMARLSAKDDLLADLFPSEQRTSARDARRQQDSVLFSKRDQVATDDYEKKTKVEETVEPTLVPKATDLTKQQNDLLAELFSTSSSLNKTSGEKPQQDDLKPKSEVVEVSSETPSKQKSAPVEKEKPPVDSKSINVDLASARDSLLMDLLGDLSPKPSEPLLSRRRTINSNTNSPDKEVIKAEDLFQRSLSSSPVHSPPCTTVPETSAETHPPASAATSKRPVTPPSPGRRRSLTIENKGALATRESDFEHLKDSLLEEILPSPSASARSSPHRRNSYSQSFEVGDSLASDGTKDPINELIEEQRPRVQEKTPAQTEPQVQVAKPQPVERQTGNTSDIDTATVGLAPVCSCKEREATLTASFDIERVALQRQLNEFTQQLKVQAVSSQQLTQHLTQQLEEQETSTNTLSQQLEARAAATAQLTQQLATAEREKHQADQQAATWKDDAANFQHRAELLEAELRGLREELSRSKRAVQEVELALARKMAEQDEADQLERRREKRALEALSAQMQRALARLTVSHQVQEEGVGYDNSAARVAAEDEARLRVIASLEGSSKRAAQHAEQERLKLAELLRELEAGARNARQGSLEDKERLRQEQQRLDALSAHLQAQAVALRDQEAAHAVYMGQQLAQAREDARVHDARLATRRTQLERDERAVYEARAEFAAFREQTALDIEREHEELRASRLALEDAWRELRADREDLEAELASHEDEFQALESMRQEVQEAEARLAERTRDVVALAEKLDAGTRELLDREQLVAQQATIVQDTDMSFANRERALERVKTELEAREQRLHVQSRQLDTARGRLTQQRREQQQLMATAKRQLSVAKQPAKVVVDNNKHWRQSEFTSLSHRSNNVSHSPVADNRKAQPWETGLHLEEDPSGLSPELRKQVEANWQRRNQHGGQRRQASGLTFDLKDVDLTSVYPSSWFTNKKDVKTDRNINNNSGTGSSAKIRSISTQQEPSAYPRKNPDLFKAPKQLNSTPPVTSVRTPHILYSARGSHQSPPTGTFQPTLRVNL